MITSGVSDYKKGESAKTFFYYLKASAFYIALENFIFQASICKTRFMMNSSNNNGEFH